MPMIKRLFHTLRYLKPVQTYGRLLFRLYRPRPDLRPRPEIKLTTGKWCETAHREPSLHGPFLFRFLNEEREISTPGDWNHPGWDKLWLYNLHYFDDLNAKGAESRKGWHADLTEKWIDENPPGQGTGWEPYPLSLRIVNWIKWVLNGNALSEEAVQSLAIQARYLSRRLERHLLGNHLLANAKALLFAGHYFKGTEAESWRTTGERILFDELNEQILPDGGHFERSPMYHSIILEDLLDLINVVRVFGCSVPSLWINSARKMVEWLSGMIHPDGEIVLFNDAAIGIASPPEQIFSYAARLGLDSDRTPKDGLVHLKQTGYARWQKGPAVAFLDVAPIGPDYLPGHAHADTLTFELSIFGQRVLVDSGTSCYGNSRERLRQRGTKAHNTVTIDDEDSSEVWSSFRVARRAKPFGLKFEEWEGGAEVVCSHDGYRRLPGRVVHNRRWSFSKGSMEILDTLHGRFSTAIGRFQLHPDIIVEEDNRQRANLLLPGGQRVAVHMTGGVWRVVESTWHHEFGVAVKNKCLEINFEGNEVRVALHWPQRVNRVC